MIDTASSCLPVTWFLMDLVQSDSGGTSDAASAQTLRMPSVRVSAPSGRKQSEDTLRSHLGTLHRLIFISLRH